MKMNDMIIGAIAIIVTIVVFLLMKKVNGRFPHPLTLPVLTATIIMVTGIRLLNISYETYYIGGQWIEKLLGPAVVALAYPLYQQRKLISRYTWPIVTGVTIGSLIGVITGFATGYFLRLDETVTLSLLSKSVTTPVAMDIAKTIDGSPSLAAIFVMVAGISGAVMGHSIFKWCNIDLPIAKGLGMGSASHAIGTSRSFQESDQEGAASTVAMILSAIIVSVLAPLFTG